MRRVLLSRARRGDEANAGRGCVIDARNMPCYLAWVYAGLGEKEKAWNRRALPSRITMVTL